VCSLCSWLRYGRLSWESHFYFLPNCSFVMPLIRWLLVNACWRVHFKSKMIAKINIYLPKQSCGWLRSLSMLGATPGDLSEKVHTWTLYLQFSQNPCIDMAFDVHNSLYDYCTPGPCQPGNMSTNTEQKSNIRRHYRLWAYWITCSYCSLCIDHRVSTKAVWGVISCQVGSPCSPLTE